MQELSLLSPWQIYLVLAVALMILEIFAPGFILFPIGFAFLLASGVAFFVASLPVQILTFAVGCAFTFWVGHRWLKPRLKDRSSVRTGVEALIGQEALVEQEINHETQTGYVKIYGESWRARSRSGEVLPAGSFVTVEDVESTQLIVRAKTKES